MEAGGNMLSELNQKARLIRSNYDVSGGRRHCFKAAVYTRSGERYDYVAVFRWPVAGLVAKL